MARKWLSGAVCRVLLVAVAIAVMAPAALAGAPEYFYDRAQWAEEGAPAYWARDIIDEVIRYEIFNGYPRGEVVFDLGDLYAEYWPESRGIKVTATLTPEFRPLGTITRAEFAAILARAAGFEDGYDPRAPVPFRDVPADAWYRPYVSVLFDKGVVRLTDRPGDLFYAGEPITRVEIAAWAARAAAAYGVNVGPAPLQFADAAQIAGSWRLDVGQSVALGIVRGYPDGTFRPQGTATRAEAAAMVMRLLEHFKQNLPAAGELAGALQASLDAWDIWSRDNPRWTFAASDWRQLLSRWYMPGVLTWWYLSEDQPCTTNKGYPIGLRMICEQADGSLLNLTANLRWTNALNHYGVIRVLDARVESATDRTARVHVQIMSVPVTLDNNRSFPQVRSTWTVYLRRDSGRWKYASETGFTMGEIDNFDRQLAYRLDGKTLADIP